MQTDRVSTIKAAKHGDMGMHSTSTRTPHSLTKLKTKMLAATNKYVPHGVRGFKKLLACTTNQKSKDIRHSPTLAAEGGVSWHLASAPFN